MHWIDWVVTPLIGAVIGYFTNWLAIKMLFRPHNEKRIFGFRLPFTPGLIPKERQRLAKTMGETLSKNVLTQDVMMKSLSSPDVAENISKAIDNGLFALETSDKTADALLSQFLGAGKTQILDDAEAQLLLGIEKLLTSPALQAECRALVGERLESFLRNPKAALPADALYAAIREYATNQGLAYLQSETFPAALQALMQNFASGMVHSGKTIGDFIPARVADDLKHLLAQKTPDLLNILTTLSQRHPEIDDALRDIVKQLAEQHFGRFIGIFVHYDTIYDNIKEKLLAYLAVSENQAMLHQKAAAWIDNLLEKDMQTLLAHFPEESRAAFAAKLASRIQSGINEAHVSQAIQFVAQKTDELPAFDAYALLTNAFPAFADTASDFVCGIITDELIRVAPRLTESLRGKLAEITPAKLLAHISDEQKTVWKQRVLDGVLFAIKTGGPRVVGAFNISKMVEDRLNAFSSAEAENLVLGVVKKELRAITNLGALLGLIIGFVPLLLDLIR